MSLPLLRALRKILLLATATCVSAAQAAAEAPPIHLAASYVTDAMGTLSGGSDRRVRMLDNLDLIADVDLARLVGWRGARIHLDVLNNLGAMPNDSAGTLMGVDNIEVAGHRLRLFEAWLEQDLGAGMSARAGLYDVNSEFYANDAAGLLIAPSFGIGSEIAATGPNGPSIFPSTALSVRLNAQIGGTGYARAAVINAYAGVPGDPGGVHLGFEDGVLLIAEAGYSGRGKIGIGAWRYSKRQADIREVDAAGQPLRRAMQGAYALLEYPLGPAEGTRATTAFVRLGISDGRTSTFHGGWQAGVLVHTLIEARPDSQFSFGVAQGILSGGFRHNQIDAGVNATRTETQIEVTAADKLAKWLTVQPDLQYIIHPGADADAGHAVVAGLRISVAL